MAQQSGNQTPNPPNVSEGELRAMKVDDLRQEAKNAGLSGVSDMREEELVQSLANTPGSSRGGEEHKDVGAGSGESELRRGSRSSTSLKYSQEVRSVEDEPEREGRSLATINHEVIKQWAEERGGTPATVSGTEHRDHLGVLRFDFGGDDTKLRHVSWQEWFTTFDERQLNFLYQEQRADGRTSNFFRLENPHREDA